MAKPTVLPRWADTVAADPTKLNAPPGAKQDIGWLVQEKPPAQWFNWLLFHTYLWIIWLQDFESTAHSWEALQSFDFGVIVAQGKVNGWAGTFQGNGTGYGVWARGGINGVGVHGVAFGATTAGVEALGDTSGGAGGPGLLALGGTGGAGAVITGNAAGAGAVVTGGASGAGLIAQGNGAAEGLRGTGGATNGIGVRAIGIGTGEGLNAVGGTNSSAVSAQTSTANASNASPKPCIDTLEGTRHGFIVDQLGLPGGRISVIRENWLFESAFTGTVGGQLIPSSLYWYNDTSAATSASINVGNASGSSDALSLFGSLRDCGVIYNGNATQYTILYSSQLVGTRDSATIDVTYEALAIDTVVGNEYRTGLIEIIAPLTAVLANHNPSTMNNRLVLVYQDGINGNKWFIEWVRNGVADAIVDTGIAITDPITIRFELIGATYGGPITRLYVNGQRFINKSVFLGNVSPVPLGIVGAIFGKVMAGSSTLRISPLEIAGARTGGTHTL